MSSLLAVAFQRSETFGIIDALKVSLLIRFVCCSASSVRLFIDFALLEAKLELFYPLNVFSGMKEYTGGVLSKEKCFGSGEL